MSVTIKKAFTSIFCVWFACVSTLGTIASAQTSPSDFEAPIIEHEENVSGDLGDVEVFAATVVDNEQLDSVSLLYRYSGDTDYIEIIMQPLVQSSYYSAKIDTSARTGQDTAIEYYIRAEDKAGNVVLKGLSFDPLVRTLVNPTVNVPNVTTSVESTSPVEVSPRRNINWLYVGLGVLLVGGLAAAAGGGGGDDDGGDPPCDLNCNVTLTLARP